MVKRYLLMCSYIVCYADICMCDVCPLALVHVGLYPECVQYVRERQSESVSQESVDGSQ